MTLATRGRGSRVAHDVFGKRRAPPYRPLARTSIISKLPLTVAITRLRSRRMCATGRRTARTPSEHPATPSTIQLKRLFPIELNREVGILSRT